jgi:hypothetical protein
MVIVVVHEDYVVRRCGKLLVCDPAFHLSRKEIKDLNTAMKMQSAVGVYTARKQQIVTLVVKIFINHVVHISQPPLTKNT